MVYVWIDIAYIAKRKRRGLKAQMHEEIKIRERSIFCSKTKTQNRPIVYLFIIMDSWICYLLIFRFEAPIAHVDAKARGALPSY
jgi:hypothetical protein